MSYRTDCSKFDMVNVGNPGSVPWCSVTGEFEPRCDLCTRPNKTKHDVIKELSTEQFAVWLSTCTGSNAEDWLEFLKGEA